MMAVLAVIIHCVLGCCARCVSAGEHPAHTETCHAHCACCDHHEHHHAGHDLCLQPATNLTFEESTADAAPQPEHHDCLGCGKVKCAFILNESPCEGLTDALLLPADLGWSDTAPRPIECDPPPRTRAAGHWPTRHNPAKLRLHLSLAVLTL